MLEELRIVRQEDVDKSNEMLYSTFMDLLDLLENLLKSNWKLISAISPLDNSK